MLVLNLNIQIAYVFLGAILEKYTKKPYFESIEEHLMKPLNIKVNMKSFTMVKVMSMVIINWWDGQQEMIIYLLKRALY